MHFIYSKLKIRKTTHSYIENRYYYYYYKFIFIYVDIVCNYGYILEDNIKYCVQTGNGIITKLFKTIFVCQIKSWTTKSLIFQNVKNIYSIMLRGNTLIKYYKSVM